MFGILDELLSYIKEEITPSVVFVEKVFIEGLRKYLLTKGGFSVVLRVMESLVEKKYLV